MLFFDTNVVIRLRGGSQEELGRFWTWIHSRHRYAIVPLVVAEVLKSLRADPERHLNDARRDLSALRGPEPPIMLPLHGAFLGRTLFGIEREHPHVSATTMAQVLEAGRRMKRVVRVKLLTLLVESPESPAIVLNYIVDPILAGEESMVVALDKTKAEKAAPLAPQEWAYEILEALQLPSTPEACDTLADACKAAYHLQRFLWLQAAKDYNPRKHRGDWIDQQLLIYLAYAPAVFVTCEKQLPARIAGSGQEDRVLAFDDVWSAAQK